MFYYLIVVSRKESHDDDGTVTKNLDKNRLVAIPPSSGKTPDHGLKESASYATISSKECTIHLHVNFAFTMGRLEPLTFSFSQNGIELKTLQLSRIVAFASLQTKEVKVSTMVKMMFCA